MGSVMFTRLQMGERAHKVNAPNGLLPKFKLTMQNQKRARLPEVMVTTIRAMTENDLDGVIALLRETAGVTFRKADSREALGRYLRRNPGLSLVAEDAGQLAGFVMAGHDGRRGYLHHLIVAQAYRRRELASRLVEASLVNLEAEGIAKTHIDVLTTNNAALEFWRSIGWQRRTDVVRYSFVRGGDENA